MSNLRKHLRNAGSKPGSLDSPKLGAGRSLFHTKLNCSPQALGECLAGVQEYLELLNKFCGAGTHMAALFQDILADSTYKDSAQLFQSSCQLLQKNLELESAMTLTQVQVKWAQLGSTKEEEGAESNNNIGKDMKLVAESFAAILQLHCQVFSMGADSTTQLNKLKSLDDLIEVKSMTPTNVLGLDGLPEPQSGTVTLDGSDGADKDPSKASPESPSKLNKFSNFLSKIGRSGVEASNSSFYVATPEMAAEAARQGEMGASRAGHGNPAGMPGTAANLEAGSSLANHMEGLRLAEQGVLMNGELASQEELDSVIDFLSGCPKMALSTVPEALPTRSVAGPLGPPPPLPYMAYSTQDQLPIGYYGSQMSMSTPVPDMYNTGAASDMAKTHTWPYRMNTKGGGAAMGPPPLDMSNPSSQAGYNFEVLNDQDYNHYLASMMRSKTSGPHMGNGMPPSVWQAGDPGLNKSWPGWFANNDGGDAAQRHWSTVGDSSSCSDESSNGEVPWMMGLDLANQMGHKRRHSSGGENNFSSCQGPAGMSTIDIRPHSVENLREAKSCGTWPSRQPWLRTGDKDGNQTSLMASQWSQPPPNSAAWNPGIASTLPKSPGYAAVAAGAVPGDVNVPPGHTKLERKYSQHPPKQDP